MSGHLARLEAANLIERRARGGSPPRRPVLTTRRRKGAARPSAASARPGSRRGSTGSSRRARTDRGRNRRRWRSCSRSRVTLLRTRVAPDVRLAQAPPQLPPLLRRPADLGRRHLDAEHRARLGGRAARAALPWPRGRSALDLPLRPVHAARPGRAASSPTASTTAARDRHADGPDGVLRRARAFWPSPASSSCGRSTRSRRSPGPRSCSTRRRGRTSPSRWSASDELPNAVALNSSLFNIARIFGPALAGVAHRRGGRRLVLRDQRRELPRRPGRPARDARRRPLPARGTTPPDVVARNTRGLGVRACAIARCR